ncbi:hypothetical protein BC629DRAFT_142796 [Irpex lacteus]|nr:hypothetical protein BC629DRAFT_142796 [Irpex lacteus]
MSISRDPFMFVARSQADLNEFALQTAQTPARADSLSLLEICFRDNCEFASLTLGSVLQLLPNLTVLVLEFSHPIPPHIFAGISLPMLEIFKSNLPHSSLVHLLGCDAVTRRACSSIQSLVLSSSTCDGSKTCPLAACCWDNTSELVCPVECAASLSGRKLMRLTVWQGRPTLNTSAVMRDWRQLPLLSDLSVTVPSGDSSVLATIPNAAPNVRTLKVIETEVSDTSITHAYKIWARLIGSLKRLDSLLVRTPHRFIRDRGNLKQEKEMLLSWLTGKRNQNTHKFRHPNCIGIHYGKDSGGTMSYWATGQTLQRVTHISPTDCDNYLH